jgi:CheY-like chemotaxis protein
MPKTLQRNILLIDDDHDNRVALRMALENSGYTVQTAANGRIGLLMLDKMQVMPDLILLDMVMPLMDGEEFLKVIEGHHSYKDLPILILTSFKDKIEVFKNKKPTILKPMDLNDFVSKVGSFFPAQ